MTEEKAVTPASKLREGISILYDMELNKYLVQRAINQLNAKIASLGHTKRFYKPSIRESDFDIWEFIWVFAGISAVIFAVIGSIYGFFSSGSGFFNKLFGIIAGPIIIGPIGGIVGFIIGSVTAFIISRRDKASREAELAEENETYNKNLAADKRRVDAELKQKKKLSDERDALLTAMHSMDIKIDEFYDCMEIDGKFRNIVSIGYMHEFVRLGISNKLDGTDGLYYLILQELRMDQMQYTLDEICSKLDKIIDHQHALYNDLQKMNKKCDSLISTAIKQASAAEKTAQNSAIAAYNSERAARELEFQNFMLLYHELR